jgi:hypothetical protein
MGDALERRTFLGLMAGAALAVIDFLYPGLSKAAEVGFSGHTAPGVTVGRPGVSVEQVDGPDPTFAGGEVVAKTPFGVILQSDATIRAVRIPAETIVWKEFDVTPDDIQLHDWVYVKGTPQSDGSLLARSGWIWVNIGRFDGVIDQVSTSSLAVRGSRAPQAHTLELSKRLEVISAHDGSPVLGHIAALKQGAEIGAVGIRLPGGGFRATRIWIW